LSSAISHPGRGGYANKLRKWPYIFLTPFVLSYVAFFLFPVLYSFVMSLFRWNVGETPTFLGLGNYVKLFTSDPYFLKSVGNTIVIMAVAIPLQILVGLLLAKLLFGDRLRGRRFFQTANYLPYITTPVAVAILFNLMFDQKIGIVNIVLVKLGIFSEGLNWLAAPPAMQQGMLILMIVWEFAGYYMLMYLAGMSSISSDVYEAAMIDGASQFQTFMKITVPLLKNTTIFLVLTSVISMFQLMDQPYLLMRGFGQGTIQSLEKPLMTVMVNFMDQSLTLGRFGYGGAITYGLFLIIAVFSFVGIKILGLGREEK
jgi:cellobiose transport system permease protein